LLSPVSPFSASTLAGFAPGVKEVPASVVSVLGTSLAGMLRDDDCEVRWTSKFLSTVFSFDVPDAEAVGSAIIIAMPRDGFVSSLAVFAEGDLRRGPGQFKKIYAKP
jgi:hypothetical protein